MGDLVGHNGKVYRATSHSQNVEPGTDNSKWNVHDDCGSGSDWVIGEAPACGNTDPYRNKDASGNLNTFVFGQYVKRRTAQWVWTCAATTSEQAPYHGTDCWVYVKSCRKPATCDKQREWKSDRYYNMGDTVSYLGRIYRAYQHHRSGSSQTSAPDVNNCLWKRLCDCTSDCCDADNAFKPYTIYLASQGVH